MLFQLENLLFLKYWFFLNFIDIDLLLNNTLHYFVLNCNPFIFQII